MKVKLSVILLVLGVWGTVSQATDLTPDEYIQIGIERGRAECAQQQRVQSQPPQATQPAAPSIIGYKCTVGEIDVYAQKAKVYRWPIYSNSPDTASAYDRNAQRIGNAWSSDYVFAECAYHHDGLTPGNHLVNCEHFRSSGSCTTFNVD
jgi:hypothetical protein